MSAGEVEWKRVSGGLYLVGIGTFLLLTTQGYLPWSFWHRALSYWPVLLVAVGVRLLFERGRAAWAILLSPLLVLGTLTYLAVRDPGNRPAERAPLRVERPQGAQRWTLEGQMALVDLQVTARSLDRALLVDGWTAPSGRGTIDITRSTSAVRVRIGHRRRDWPFLLFPGRPRLCDLGLSQDLPLALDLRLALAHGTLDLTSAPVSRFELQGAFNDLTVRLGAPEADVHLDFAGAFNRVHVVVPPSTPVRVGTDGFLNSVDGRPEATSLQGPGYHLSLDGAFNHLVIRSP